MEQALTKKIISWDQGSKESLDQQLVCEEPLAIRINGKPYSVVMRTPGEELAHAAGLCLAEGVVDHKDDFTTIGSCEDGDLNVVTATITEARSAKIAGTLDRREYISQTSCGICGKEIVKDLQQEIRPVEDNLPIDTALALTCLESLGTHQPLRKKTSASHAAALFDNQGHLLSIAEDVGRHNALDKVIGKLFLEEALQKASLAVLSSRISYELVQKAARAKIPVIFAVSRPTSLAVDLATEMNMTLACLAKGKGLLVFCGEHRLI
ncbi:MAG: formate dehydrogenase accessory sulfurtransferase FdhD [Desulfobacterales bacterium]|nr:formate dehydrogenase accessory sulfurtransferase FdhD [Desulfobacterales bacterium]